MANLKDAGGTPPREPSDVGETPKMSTSIADAVAPSMVAAQSWQTDAPEVFSPKGPAIQDSEDLRRIVALPRRPALDPDSPEAQAMVEYMMAKYARANPTCRCAEIDRQIALGNRTCLTRYLPVQAWALYEIGIANGLIGQIPVGAGKTVLGIQAVLSLRSCPTALLLIPPSLVEQIILDYQLLAEHFVVPGIVVHMSDRKTWTRPAAPGMPTLHVLPYSRLSQPESSDWLEGLRPSAIIADECDSLKDRTSARTMRVMRYFSGNDQMSKEERQRRLDATRFCGWTGSITDSSILEYCLAPEMRVLTSDLRWVPAGDVVEGDTLVGFDEELKHTKMRPSIVEGVKRLTRPRVKIITTRGTLVCSVNHKWVLKGRARTYSKKNYTQLGVSGKSGKWIDAQDVRPGDILAYFARPWEHDTSYEGGYLSGLLDGEGCVAKQHGEVTFAQRPGPVLERYKRGLIDRGFLIADRHQTGGRGDCRSVAPNGEAPNIRLLGTLRPIRLMQKSVLTWVGKEPSGKNTRHARVLSVEALPDGEVVAIQTSTKTLMAEGFLSHNCHLSLLALRGGSPVPMNPEVAEEWARCLDASPNPAPPGELMELCSPGEDVRHAYRRRLRETMGFVITTSSSVEVVGGGADVELGVVERAVPEIPEIVREALAIVRAGERPDTLDGAPGNDTFDDPMTQARCATEVATGMFYKNIYPRGEPDELVKKWLAVRRFWNSELREKTMLGHQYLDSPKLCEAAAQRAWGDVAPRRDRPDWKALSWPAWRDIKDLVVPKQKAVRLHPYLVENAAEWAMSNRGIVWFGMSEFAQWLHELTRLPVHQGGIGAGERLRNENGNRSIISSIKSNGRGRDGLQHLFDHQLVANTPSSATMWEQLLGRLHRRGQRSNEVLTEVYLHTSELRKAFDQALRRADYVESTMGSRQKLRIGFERDDQGSDD